MNKSHTHEGLTEEEKQMVATAKKESEERATVPLSLWEAIEMAKMIPLLNRKVLDALGMIPVKLLFYFPEDMRKELIDGLCREYPGLRKEYLGEFYGLPHKAWRTELAITFLRWIGDESEYWKDVNESKTKPFFYWKNWWLHPNQYDKESLKSHLATCYDDELRAIVPTLA